MKRLLFAVLIFALTAGSADAQMAGNATRLQNRPIAQTAPTDTQVLCWDATPGIWKPCDATAGSTFVALTDTPAAYTGAGGYFVKVNAGGTALEFSASSSAPQPALLDSTQHTDTLTGTVVRGDVIIGNSTPKWSRLAKGTSGSVLTSGASDVAWTTYYLSGSAGQTYTFPSTSKTLAASDASNLAVGSDARGDILIRGASAYGRLAKGTQYSVLTMGANDPAWTTFFLSGTTAATYTFPGATKTLAASDASNLAVGSDAQGDILVRGAAAYGRLAKGSSGAVLTGDGTDTKWSTYILSGSSGQTYTFPTTSKTVAASDGSNLAFGSDAQGDLIMRGGSAYGRLADAATAGYPLVSGGAAGDPAYLAIVLAGGTNTFSITNGTASLDVAAGATLNIDTNLQVQTGAVVITGNAGGSSALTLPNQTLSLTGTFTNGYLCNYTSAGTVIGCNVNPATFQAALTYPVTGPAAPTAGNLTKWDTSGQVLADGPKIGTFTDAKWCSYSTAGGLACTENAPTGGGTITSVGDILTGAAGDSSHGISYLYFIETGGSPSKTTKLQSGDLADDIILTMPTSTGTLALTSQLIGGSWASPSAALGTGTPVAGTFTTLTAGSASSLTLGTASTAAGAIIFKNATNANAFTITSGVSGAAIGWTLPTAAAGGDNYLLNADADGTMGYTDPATFSPVAGSASIVTVGTITSGVWSGTAVGANKGGTGMTSYTVGDLLYASGSTTLSALAGVATGQVLVSGGVGAAPAWSASPSGLTSIATGANPADSGAIRLSNAESINWEANPAGTDIAGISVDTDNKIQIGASGAVSVTITPATLISGVITAGTGPTTLTDAAGKILSSALNTVATAQGGTGATAAGTQYGLVYYTTTTQMASTLAGTSTQVLHGNATGAPTWSAVSMTADTTAGNWKVFYSDGSGVVKELALGTSGYYLKSNGASSAPTFDNPGGTFLADNNIWTGNNTFGDGDTDTLTIRSMVIGGNSRAVQIAASLASPTYATATNELYVAGDIETAGNVYAASLVSSGSDGERGITLQSNTALTPTADQIYFINDVLYFSQAGAQKTPVRIEDAQTITGKKTFQGDIAVGDTSNAGAIDIWDGSANTITITAPSLSGNYTLTLPTTDGNDGQFLKTDGSGALSWDSPTAAADETGGTGAIQFNSGGALLSDIGLVFDGTTDKLTLGSSGGATTGSLELYYTGTTYAGTIVPNSGMSSDVTITLPSYTTTLLGAGANTFTAAQAITAVNPASGSLDALTLSGTLGVMNGTDTFRGVYLNYTNANHGGSTNVVALIDVAATAGDANSNFYGIRFGNFTGTTGADGEVERAISIGTGFDHGIYNLSPSYFGDGSSNGISISATGVTTFAGAATLTSVPITTDIRAISAGGATVGTALLPFSSVYIGAAATNNVQLTATSAAARSVTIPDIAANSTILVTDSTTTTAAKIPLSTTTAGKHTYSTATYPSTATTTGAYLRADGTNWITSTLILPNAGTAYKLAAYTAANTLTELAAVGGTGTILRGATGAIPAWSTSTFADTYGAGTILYAGTANTVTGLAAGAQYKVLAMGASLPEWTDTLNLSALNMSSATSSIPWVVGTGTASNTAEGTAYWESDTNTLTIGDGATGVGFVFTAAKYLTITESLTLNALPIGGLAVATGANTLGSLAVGATTEILVGGGAGTVPAWTTATGSGAPMRGTSPSITTSILPASVGGADIGSTAAEWGDLFLADTKAIKFGNDQDVTLTHVADTGLTLNGAMKLHFGDTGTYLNQAADGVMQMASDTEIRLLVNDEDLKLTKTGTDGITIGTNTGVTTITTALNFVTTGTISGAIPVVTDANGRAVDASECYGTLHVATGSGTWALPAAQPGMSLCVLITGASDVLIDVDNADDITLDGTQLTNGYYITNGTGSSSGDFACLVAIDADHWYVMGKQGTWTAQTE